jgi:hypothetical protein
MDLDGQEHPRNSRVDHSEFSGADGTVPIYQAPKKSADARKI